MATSTEHNAWRTWLAARAVELETAILFSTRLPLVRTTPVGGAALAQAVWALPVGGVAVGIVGALVYALAYKIGLPAWPAAALTLAATLAVTGCLHEDGLADTADGFGGGAAREQKLAIMRDSRIGTYGVCALATSLIIRVSALASLADPAWVTYALIAAHTAARGAMPLLMYFVPPARSDGLSFAAGRPPAARVAVAAAIGVLVLFGCLEFSLAIAAVILLAIAVVVMARSSLRQIGGQTGDVIGALEQGAEIIVLLVALR